jgi:hypothetical protein
MPARSTRNTCKPISTSLPSALTAVKTNGVGSIAARTIEQLLARLPLTRKMLIRETVPYRAFRT